MVKAKKYNVENRVGKKRIVCRVCLKDHPLRFCKKFLNMDYAERMKIISIYQHCAGCLGHDHTWRTCTSTGKCHKCGDMHHTLLHKPGPRSSREIARKRKARQHPSTSESISENESHSSYRHRPRSSKALSQQGPSSSKSALKKGPSSSRNSHSESKRLLNEVVPYRGRNAQPYNRRKNQSSEVIPTYTLQETVLLKPTAMVKIVCGDRYIHERALIDPTNEISIISESLARRMSQKIVKIGKKARCLLRLRGNHGMSTTVETYAEVRRDHKVMTPKRSVDVRITEDFPGLQLADEQFYTSGPVFITLGGDLYSKIIRNGVSGGTFGKPLAQFTIFGYIISGLCTP